MAGKTAVIQIKKDVTSVKAVVTLMMTALEIQYVDLKIVEETHLMQMTIVAKLVSKVSEYSSKNFYIEY